MATLTPCPRAGVGRLILDILHALSEGHDATGHEVQGAVSPSLLLLVRRWVDCWEGWWRGDGMGALLRQQSCRAVPVGTCSCCCC